MTWLKANAPFMVAVILFITVMLAVFPFYQFYVDPDATAYLTLAGRYAQGDYMKAVNGYWSPWSIWLTALLIKYGYASFKAAIIVNSIAGLGFLLISHSLFLRFKLREDAHWFFALGLVGFLVYAVFAQSFDDLWECFFLLLVLRIMLRNDFSQTPALWVITGFVGALAYFSKAYAFPFFILEVWVCSYLITRMQPPFDRRRWFIITGTCVLSMLALSAPWIWLLYHKYGVVMTSTAGSLNMSWYLVGHPQWKPGIGALLPPVYPDSPSYWEDPYMVNGAAPHFWQSGSLFLHQLVRLGYNILKLFQSANELSSFFTISLGLLILLFFSNLLGRFDKKFQIVCLSFLLFPLGYLLVNFQGRYLWYLVPLSMLVIGLMLQQWSQFRAIGPLGQRFTFMLIAFSFLVYPILSLKDMYRKGRHEYRMAAALKELGIRGSFATAVPYGPRTQDIMRLAYFSGNPYYALPLAASKQEILKDMRKYQVRYYFHFSEPGADDFVLTDEQGQPFPDATQGRLRGLKVFALQ